jgi:hypothetical protein
VLRPWAGLTACGRGVGEAAAGGPAEARLAAGVLKQYLRGQVVPVLTDHLLVPFHTAAGMAPRTVDGGLWLMHGPLTPETGDADERVAAVARLLTQLPLSHARLLRAVMDHVQRCVRCARARVCVCVCVCIGGCVGERRLTLQNRVHAHEATNKMTLAQLGIVFAPLLQMPAPLFAMLVTEHGRLFV